MDIGFVWDKGKYDEVRKKHNVQFYEVVSVFDDNRGYDAPDPQGHPDRWMYVGKSITNRVLVVIYIAEGEEFHRLITAFDAKGEVLNEYNQRS